MNYMKYKRFFVLMEDAETERSRGEKRPGGHVKIETGNRKGAMSCTVQNLKSLSEKPCQYKLIFFGKRREKTIYALAGNLAVNREGNGETHFRFDPNNFDGKGNALDRFSLIVVAAVSEEREGTMRPVLTGILEWEEQDRPPAEQEKDRPEGDTVLVSGGKEVLEEANAVSDKVNYNRFYNQCLLRFCRHTCNVSGYYKNVSPFSFDETGAEWKRMANVGNLPLVSPGAHYFASQYRHYLFGVQRDEHNNAERYFFAVPGRNLPAEQPDGGESGFVLWQSIHESGDEDADGVGTAAEPGAYGYWILAVNAASGDIEAP